MTKPNSAQPKAPSPKPSVKAASKPGSKSDAKDDLKTAREQTKIAEGMLDKFARKLGGD